MGIWRSRVPTYREHYIDRNSAGGDPIDQNRRQDDAQCCRDAQERDSSPVTRP